MKRLHKEKLELRKGSHVEGVLQKTLRVSQLVGLAPVRFVTSRTLTFVVISRPWYIYGIMLTMILNCIICYHIITNLQNYLNIYLEEGSFHIIMLILKYTMTSFFVTFRIGKGIQNMKLYKSVIDQIRKIKTDLGALEHDVPKTCQAWFLVTCFATNLLFIVIYNIWIFPRDFSYGYYTLIVEYQLVIISVLQLIIIAFYINTALQEVNDKLWDLMSLMNNDNIENDYEMPEPVQVPIYSINIAIDTLGMVKPSVAEESNTIRLKMAERLRLLCQAFVQTCKVLKEFNTHMNFIFVMFYSLFIVRISERLYSDMKYVQVNNLKAGQYFKIIAIFIKIFFNIIEMILFVEPFYRAKVKISRIRLTVCRMMSLVSSGDPMLDELDVFFKQLLLNDFSYTASGLFVLERNLTYTIICVIATVLSILQEFMKVDDNNMP